MNIQMIGIDHHAAGVRIREQFSFTAARAERAMQTVKSHASVRGCVLLSTCNRMELYLSMEEDGADLFELIFLISRIPADPIQTEAECRTKIRRHFKVRKGKEAARHLFYLAAGFKSQVLGEDQILTQVKDALKKAREIYCTDALLEVLFRDAVAAGKEVRTKALPVRDGFSAIHCAAEGLKRQGYDFAGKKCLVIGNGHMGKTAAELLRDEGALVTVTVRQYKSGMVEIPKGCERIHYGERYGLMPDCDLVISATVSPNLTVRKEQLAEARKGRLRQQIYIDLAVPRDMEEEIGGLEGIRLYDIDSFQNDGISGSTCSGISGSTCGGFYDTSADIKNGICENACMEMQQRKQKAEAILSQRLSEFWEAKECRELVPRIWQIGQRAAEDVRWRMGRELKQLSLSNEEQQLAGLKVQESAKKVIGKMLFALRDELGKEELERCVEVWERMKF